MKIKHYFMTCIFFLPFIFMIYIYNYIPVTRTCNKLIYWINKKTINNLSVKKETLISKEIKL